jgi:hypothetical protein
MTVAQTNSGTQTATIGTTHTLATPATTGKTYFLMIDLTNLAAGDVIDVFLQSKVLSTSSFKNIYSLTLAGPQSDPYFMSIPIPSAQGVQFQIKQSAGTGRAFDWSVQSLD